MTYFDLAVFSKTWGMIFLIVLFLSAVTYALWPSNKNKFSKAAQMPLFDEEGENNE
jgi:cytochrome c oxidase cbb3-type subunit IV